MTTEERHEALINNDLNFYLVDYDDGRCEVKHGPSHLQSILDCGHDPADYGIKSIKQCWNGEEMGDE